jgi:hypothetical protein
MSMAETRSEASLVSQGTAVVELTEERSLSQYFGKQKDLYVWKSFRSHVIARARVRTGPTLGMRFKLNQAELVRDVTDEEIETELPADNFFNEKLLCLLIAELVERWRMGQNELLVDKGRNTLFYTKFCVVGVRLGVNSVDSTSWRLGAWERDSEYWKAGSRVCYPDKAIKFAQS